MKIIQDFLVGFSWESIIKTGLRVVMILIFAWIAMKLLQKFLKRLEKRLIKKSKIRSALGTRAKGRKIRDAAKPYQLREPSVPYGDRFGGKNEDIGVENAYIWETNPE